MEGSTMKCCVIGAGYAGLGALRHLKDEPNCELLVAYERQGNVGGLWNYDPRTGLDQFGIPVHSALYENVRTNFPRSIMDFPDFPNRDGNEPSFVPHSKVLQFLQNYALRFGLLHYVKFFHMVKEVKPNGEGKWLVTVENLQTGEEIVKTFDKVFIGSGHFFHPILPENLDSSAFHDQAQVLHSKNYRSPEGFRGKTVAVLGAGPSGMDIASDIANLGDSTRVYLCHEKNRCKVAFPVGLEQKSKIVEVRERSIVVREQNEELFVDAIIFCTGYKYSVPFLQGVHLETKDNHLAPLWKDICHVHYPDSLFFIGLQRQVAQGYLIDTQMRFISALLRGEVRVPREPELLRSIEADKQNLLVRGHKPTKLHKLGFHFRRYMEELSELAEIPATYRIPEVVLDIFEDVISQHDLCALRDQEYVIIQDGEGRESFFKRPYNPSAQKKLVPNLCKCDTHKATRY